MWTIHGIFKNKKENEKFLNSPFNDVYDTTHQVQKKTVYSFSVFIYKNNKADNTSEMYNSFEVNDRQSTPTFVKEVTVTRLDELDMPVTITVVDRTTYIDGMPTLCLALRFNGDAKLVRFCFDRTSNASMRKKSLDIAAFRSLVVELDCGSSLRGFATTRRSSIQPDD